MACNLTLKWTKEIQVIVYGIWFGCTWWDTSLCHRKLIFNNKDDDDEEYYCEMLHNAIAVGPFV